MNTKATYDHNTAHTIGIRLRHARERLNFSQKEIAERLHLKVSIVRDIEEDKIPSDLALTFLRGYIRSYAKLVRVPENELFPIANQEYKIPEEKGFQRQCFSLGRSCKRYDKWITIFSWFVFFMALALTGTWWWQKNREKQEEITSITNQSNFRLHHSENNTQYSLPSNEENHSMNNTQVSAMLLSPFQTQDSVRNTTKNSKNIVFSSENISSFRPHITTPLGDNKNTSSL